MALQPGRKKGQGAKISVDGKAVERIRTKQGISQNKLCKLIQEKFLTRTHNVQISFTENNDLASVKLIGMIEEVLGVAKGSLIK